MKYNRKSDYFKKLQDPRWQKKRLEIMERDKFKCVICGDDKTELQVHHTGYEKGDPWDTRQDWLATVCSDCHGKLTVCKELIKSLLTPKYEDLQQLVDCLRLLTLIGNMRGEQIRDHFEAGASYYAVKGILDDFKKAAGNFILNKEHYDSLCNTQS